ncbi:MAG: GNAT family N-acetyltransferase [Leptospirales bacterium]|jgi:GNAT superfamily N-acetyltransferase
MEGGPTTSDATIRMIEEFSLNAWPALQQLYFQGWILRFAEGFSRRANSVHSSYGPVAGGDLKDLLELCEGVYLARGLAPVFRITPASRPGNLDEALASRGYRREGETLVLSRNLSAPDGQGLQPPGFDEDAGGAGALLCEGLERGGEEWLAGVTELRGRPAKSISVFRNILSGIITRACYVLLKSEDRPAACAMGVLQQNWVGVLELARADAFRGRGYGRAALNLVEEWAAAYGANRAYLACEATNRPALQMYHDAGYSELYRYWYRVRPAAGERP